jgi:hypothetical protein
VKYLLDRIAAGSAQWRLIADTTKPTVWVIDAKHVYEFSNRREATAFVADAYRKVADLRSMQPGQNYNLQMADGSTKIVQVQNQTPNGVQVLDPSSGQSMTIPHVQPGAEPTPVPPGQQGKPGAPAPNQSQPGVQQGVSPENQTERTYALCAGDLRKTAREPGKVPQNCEHGHHTHLLHKDTSDPEKFCPTCGTVYAASVKRPGGPLRERPIQQPVIKKPLGPGLPPRKRPGGPLNERPIGASRGDDEDDGEGSYSEQKDERDWHWKDKKEPKKAGCDSDYWVEGDSCDCPAHKGKTRREAFRLWKNRERIVHAFDLIKEAEIPSQQAMPSGDVSNMGETLKMDEKSPGDFAEEPEGQQSTGDPNAKRKLTPHEIIEEAESLIRTALVKGVRIGAAELSEYMTQYYQNSPDELMQGIALAWQKVQYEESMEGNQQAGDPNAPQGQGFGPKAPTTPEEAAQMAPKNGPIRTKRLM